MDTNELSKVRNLLKSYEGKLLVEYLQNVLTEKCTKNINPETIKGFGECIHTIKDIVKKKV